MTRKTMLLAGVGVAALVVAAVVGQQVYQGEALRAVETELAQVRAQGIAGNAVAWTGQERSGDTVVLREVTVTAPDGKVVAQAARGVVKPRVTGRIDVTAADVTLAVGSGADRLRVGQMVAENLAVASVPAAAPAGGPAGTADMWLAAIDGASVRATDLTALDGVTGGSPPSSSGHLDSLDAAVEGGRLTRLVAERFTAKAPVQARSPTVQDAALERLEMSGLDLRRLLALRESAAPADVKAVRAAIRAGDVRVALRGLRVGPAVLDSGELTLTPAGTDRLALAGGRVGPQVARPAPLDGVELASLKIDNRFGAEGWTGETDAEMKELGHLRLTAKGQGQAQGDTPVTVQRVGFRLEDAGLAARIAAFNGVTEQNRAKWAQMAGGMAKSVLGGVGVKDDSGLDARLAAFLGKGTKLEFAVESTQPGGFAVPGGRAGGAMAWLPPQGSIRVVAP